jgi:hypothetical protein
MEATKHNSEADVEALLQEVNSLRGALGNLTSRCWAMRRASRTSGGAVATFVAEWMPADSSEVLAAAEAVLEPEPLEAK